MLQWYFSDDTIIKTKLNVLKLLFDIAHLFLKLLYLFKYNQLQNIYFNIPNFILASKFDTGC